MSATPETDAEFDFVRALEIANQRVRSLPYWRRFIDGTPLSNDIGVLMAQAYCEGADFARRLEQERDAARQNVARLEQKVAELASCLNACDFLTDNPQWMHLHKINRAALAATEEPKAPRLARNQRCGCVVCICEDEHQCQGCGASNCGTHPVGQIPNPVFQ